MNSPRGSQTSRQPKAGALPPRAPASAPPKPPPSSAPPLHGSAAPLVASIAQASAAPLVARSKLKLRDSSELNAWEAGDLAAGMSVVIIEQLTLPDGTHRARVAAAVPPGEVLGWVSTIAKSDGKKTLVPASHPEAVQAIKSSEAGVARQRAKELAASRESTVNLFIARSKLKVRAGSALESDAQGEVPAGTKVYVTERWQLADGTRRALISRSGEEGTTATLGWVSCVAKDGRDTLIAEFRR